MSGIASIARSAVPVQQQASLRQVLAFFVCFLRVISLPVARKCLSAVYGILLCGAGVRSEFPLVYRPVKREFAMSMICGISSCVTWFAAGGPLFINF